jgi:glycerol-3-phosphate dehydrogenase
MKTESFDVVIIGAGVTGAGTALDAATRGLSVALIEQRDYASGTSSRSSKLFHGGLRYLEQLNFKLVMEALRERNLMLNLLCPHLASPIRFLYPLQHPVWERAYVGAGILMYDLLAAMGDNPLPYHRHLTRSKALRMAPSLRRESLVGAIIYSDARVDDARHTMMIARTAAQNGAVMAPSVRAIGFQREGDRVVGVHARDLESGGEFVIRAKQVVNTTGVWTDEVQERAGRGRIHVRASKGIHLVVPRDRIHSDTGMILRTEQSVLFVIPWGRHWIVGTTDTEWNLDLAHPAASRADIDYLLEHVNTVLKDPLRPEDIEGVYAGLRPLLEGESDATSRLSREHAVSQAVPGLISVAGGKYTTYRVMAQDAVDAVAANLDERVPPSVTASTPLVGADGYHALWNQRHQLAEESGLHVARIEHLLGRYGSLIWEILAVIRNDPKLGQPLPGADDYLAAEISYAASHEGALHLDDALTRRTRISIEMWDRGVTAAEPTARLMGEVLGWDEETIAREIEHYLARVAAERESQEQIDDHTADAARLGAPDVRTGHARS